MIRTVRSLGILAATAASVASLALLSATAPAGAATPVTISFSASSDGSSAGLAQGTNHAGAVLHVATTPGFGQVLLNGVSRDIATTSAPALAVTNYAAGTPRMEIVPEIGPDSVNNDATGYPDPALCGAPTNGICWSLGSSPNTYTATWPQVQTYIHALGGIKAVYVVADGSQATPYTADVTSLSWDGQALLPEAVANRLSASYICGNFTGRDWKVTSLAGTGVVYFASVRLNSGAWFHEGAHSVGAEQTVTLHTTRGGVFAQGLRLGFSNGLGGFTYIYAASHNTPACA